jgi:hypothetical protein
MTTLTPSHDGLALTPTDPSAPDHRGSWLPNGRMIASRFMELRKRRGLMAAIIIVFIGIPTVFLGIRLILHGVDPKSYGPAGGYDIFSSLVAGVMYVFGFIIAATLGCTAGSLDLTEGVFRHLVITGRSRLALYFARIPAGLAIVIPVVAVGFAIVCGVCSLSAPSKLSYQGTVVPAGLSRPAFASWAEQHPSQVLCSFPFNSLPADVSPAEICGPIGGPGGFSKQPGGGAQGQPTKAQLEVAARDVANQNYGDYAKHFLKPSVSLMVETGLWLELGAIVAFLVGLGLSSLMGQRIVPVILLLVLELVLTPLFARTPIVHLINVQRGLLGLATSHLEPNGLPSAFGGNGAVSGARELVPESTGLAIGVIVGWVVLWTGLGAWRMARRDA